MNTVHDSEYDNETDSALICHRADMEINNNYSLNLHECEDKGDKADKRMHCENNFSRSEATVTGGLSLELISRKIVNGSSKETIEQTTMEAETISEATSAAIVDSDESPITTPGDKILIKIENSDEIANERVENDINNKETITSDSERLDKANEEGETKITTSNVPSINERKTEVTQSNGESMPRFIT